LGTTIRSSFERGQKGRGIDRARSQEMAADVTTPRLTKTGVRSLTPMMSVIEILGQSRVVAHPAHETGPSQSLALLLATNAARSATASSVVTQLPNVR
jgi:hypothetical protein